MDKSTKAGSAFSADRSNAQSDIQKFYKDTTVFLTGSTGFLGKLIIEKLLRVCDVREICCLVRCKKGVQNEERFDGIFKHPCFDRLKEECPGYRAKVRLIIGDCEEPKLGLSESDREHLLHNVNVVLHCAATVRFVEDLKTAYNINCRATGDVVALCKQMRQIKSMIHVSTAYSNCNRLEIDEKFYNSNVTPATISTMVDTIDSELIDKITNSVIGDWPNTYVYTKNVAENIIRNDGKGIPVGIVRPSIILSTDKEPMPGWIDNFFGPIGLSFGVSLGVVRVVYVKKENGCDIVPADYVINHCLAAAWDVAENWKAHDNTEENEIKIYNFTTSSQNKLSWQTMIEMLDTPLRKLGSTKCLWHSSYTLTSCYYYLLLLSIFRHFIPAVIIDTGLKIIGKEPKLWKIYCKLLKFTDIIGYFSLKEWKFDNNNVRNLWTKLSPKDKELFYFDVSVIKWKEYFEKAGWGGRLYLLKDTPDTVPAGNAKLKKLMYLHYFLVTVFYLVALKGLYCIYNYVFFSGSA